LFLHISGLAFLVGYFFILPEKAKDFTEVYAFVIIPSFILSHLLVACIAFLGKDSETKFWQFNKNLFINTFLTGIFTGVLTGGVLLAILAVQQLFGFHFKDELYGETFVTLAIVGSSFIFLLFNENGLEYLEKDGSYPVILKFFTQFILIPLLLIYVIILYFYSGKILLNWELPEGWVSYLILAYSIVGILALLLVHPLKESTAKSWVKMFSKVFYFSLLPLIVLLFTAIFTRVLQYGFTEARYYVFLLAVWLLSVVLYFIFIKKATIKFIPMSLFLLGLFSLIFPYFNTFSVAKRSQKHELENILNQYHLLENGKINFNKKVTSDVMNNISDKFEFLSMRLEYDYLSNLLDDKFKKGLVKSETWHVNNFFKNVTDSSQKNKARNLQLYNSAPYYNINSYDYMIHEQDLLGHGVKLGQNQLSLISEIHTDTPTLKLTLNSTEEVDFIPSIEKLFENRKGMEGDMDSDSLFVESNIGKYHVKIIFGSIGQNTEEKKVTYYFSNAIYLIKENSNTDKK